MTIHPVLALLLLDLLLFLAAFLMDKSAERWEFLLLSALFFVSGMPALIYQVIWQRTLFSIYGVNVESVAVVVSAFMLGLGLGSILGGRWSARFPRHGILLFGVCEIGVATFGILSLRIFHWAASFTAGSGLPSVIVFSLLLLLLPTMLMGATLPLLVEHLVRRSGRVGLSVSRLYFVNTLGSAVACYFCAQFLLRDFGLSGSLKIAACLNVLVGLTAFLYGKSRRATASQAAMDGHKHTGFTPAVSLHMAMFLAALSGCISLGFEISWFRVFSIASMDRAPAFSLLLAIFLGGIAAGAHLAERFTRGVEPKRLLQVIGAMMIAAGTISSYLPPLVAYLMGRRIPYLSSAPFFFLTAALIGAVMPLLCQLSVPPGEQAGKDVSLIYVSNIVGSVAGSLGIGFVLMQYLGLSRISLLLGILSIASGMLIASRTGPRFHWPPLWVVSLGLAAVVLVAAAPSRYALLYERLAFGGKYRTMGAFADVVENRNGVVCVTPEGALFGGSVYDGYFRVDPQNDANAVIRAFFLSAVHPAPKRMLMIGLASGSWGQIFVNDPRIESLEVVEINPAYLQLISKHPVVQSLLVNPKLRLHIDDGRRWLIAHPEERYDLIVVNSTFHWRAHSSGLISQEFFRLVHKHLNPGGIYYFNSTGSFDAMATALREFPYGLRVMNFLMVSDSPIVVDKARWETVLREYRIDGRPLFPATDEGAQKALANYLFLADTLEAPPTIDGLESAASLRPRVAHFASITDDNMGAEWGPDEYVPWREVP
jgi:predicted membrane-bound spermidine synthase